VQPLIRDNIRLAATVMLLRDTAAGMEVYMVQRPGRGDFPDLHVFPGGKVDEDDWAPQLCFGIDDDAASARLGINRGGLRYWVAVARECFEECGVLMAHHQDSARQPGALDFSLTAVHDKYANYRERLLTNEISFAEICQRENLCVACDLLGYFSHWLTPETAPRRFDTRFFVAAMPPDQRTLAHTEETADDQWEKPAEALAKFESKQWQMIDPTLRSLETLSQFDTVSEALAGVNEGNHLMALTPELNRQGMQLLR
jgi:8-oxo-dGTP pyrophosphatase MutT (NUDIX family)